MKLFVYGSLRMGLYNYELYLKGKSRFLGYGYVIGELYSLKERSYPALLPGNSRILGEIYEVDEALMHWRNMCLVVRKMNMRK